MKRKTRFIETGNEAAGAIFSPCRGYRYRLWRRWAPGPLVLWIMLNPSTADESTLDPTITRCRNFTRDWGYAGIEIANLYAWRATRPGDLFRAPDPIGRENDGVAADIASRAGLIILAWGNHGAKGGRAAAVLDGLACDGLVLHCLRMTRAGQPAHPLYLPSKLVPQIFNRSGECFAGSAVSID